MWRDKGTVGARMAWKASTRPAASSDKAALAAGAMASKMPRGRKGIIDDLRATTGAQALADSRSLRRAALLHKVPYYTTLSGAVAAAKGIKAYLGGDLEVRALQSYFGGRA